MPPATRAGAGCRRTTACNVYGCAITPTTTATTVTAITERRQRERAAPQPACFAKNARRIGCRQSVARRQLNQLHPAAVEERVETNENGIRSLIPKCCEGRTDLPAGSGVEDLNLHPDGARCCSRFSRRSVGICRVCRVDQH